MKLGYLVAVVNLICWMPGLAFAHVSEQGFVLLLPTEAYTAAGVAAVALTVLALFVLPASAVKTAFAARQMATWQPELLQNAVSLVTFFVLGFMI